MISQNSETCTFTYNPQSICTVQYWKLKEDVFSRVFHKCYCFHGTIKLDKDLLCTYVQLHSAQLYTIEKPTDNSVESQIRAFNDLIEENDQLQRIRKFLQQCWST